jgi:hypothetical protein
MEHDHTRHTTTNNLATHTRHRHTRRAASRLPNNVIVITPPRASDSDFTGGNPIRASQTAPEPRPVHATNWPHTPRTDSSKSDDELHKGIMLDLRRPSTLQTTRHRSSPPQRCHRSSDSTAAQQSRRTHQTHRVKPTNEAPPRPIFRSSHHLCQTAHLDLTQQPDNHHHPTIPDRSQLRDDAPNKEETPNASIA